MLCHDALVSQRRIAPPHRVLADADAVTRARLLSSAKTLAFLLVVRARIGPWLSILARAAA